MRYERSHYDCVVIYDYFGIIREDDNREISFNNLKYNTFELIEDETIDIESIEELLKIEPYEADKTDIVINRNKINEILKLAKQQEKRIKKLEEK